MDKYVMYALIFFVSCCSFVLLVQIFSQIHKRTEKENLFFKQTLEKNQKIYRMEISENQKELFTQNGKAVLLADAFYDLQSFFQKEE